MVDGKNLLKILYFLSVALLFLPSFVFPIGTNLYRVLFIPLLTFFAVYIVINYKTFINKLYFLCKKTPIKYLMFFIMYLFISSLIIMLFHFFYGINSIIYLLQFVILYITPCFLLSAYFIPKIMTLEKFIKIYSFAIFAIFCFGIIEYFGGKILGINFINSIQHFLANGRYLYVGSSSYQIRLCSVFDEPGWLGGFIFLNFPLIYKLGQSKFRIFKNNYLNIIIKKTLIPLAWTNIIFTLSPIWLLFCVLQALIIFWKKIFKFIFSKRFLLYSGCAVLFGTLIIIIINLTIGNKLQIAQLVRIITALTNMINLETFIIAEPSLGSRLVSYIAQFHVFCEHPILGVGMNNDFYYTGNIIDKYSIPMTDEVLIHYQQYLRTGKMKTNLSAFYTLISETGIIGTTLYYTFVYKSVKLSKIITNRLQESLIKDFSGGLYLSLCFYIFMTFYDTVLASPYNWFFIGLAISVYMYYLKLIDKSVDKI